MLLLLLLLVYQYLKIIKIKKGILIFLILNSLLSNNPKKGTLG